MSECIICQGNQVEKLTEKNGYLILRCLDCGHGWVAEMPDEETISNYYATQESDKQYAFPEESVRKHSVRLLKWLGQVQKPPGKMLDVGCGQGIHLRVAKELGWSVEGIDHSKTARQMCESNGIAAYETLEDFETKKKATAYHVVSLWEVIEHIPDPGAFIAQIKKHLAEDSALILSTPNFNSRLAHSDIKNWYQMRPPEHLHYFTPKSIDIFFKSQGFTVLNVMTIYSWHPWVEGFYQKLSEILKLPNKVKFLLKVATYKFGKPLFDLILQSKQEGETLLLMAALNEPREKISFRKYFYF